MHGKGGSIKPNTPYHLTCVVNNLLPVFSQPQIARMVIDNWLHLRQHNGMKLYGYVIMEEHLHFMASADQLDQCLAGFMEQTAELTYKYLVENKMERFLLRLTNDQVFKLWQVPSEIEEIISEDMMRETLDYIHINPVKRGYVDHINHWRYSSARNYAGEPELVSIDHLIY
jgi:putative transposase